MQFPRLLAVVLAGALSGGEAEASPWFADNFDSYGDPLAGPDQTAFQAAWSFEIYDYPGDIVFDPPHLLGDPFAWSMAPRVADVRTRRSLVPAIQAVDSSKNAVQGTAANPLIVRYQTQLGNDANTTDDRTLLWLELIGQEITSGSLDDLFAAPSKNPGSYDQAIGVCDASTSTCTAGWLKIVGEPCDRNSDCDTPMWLDFLPSTSGTCQVLDSSLPVPRPSLAVGAYGGRNGLHPKAEPGDNCSSHTTIAIANMVTFDGDRWSKLTGNAPLGSSADSILTSRFTTNVALTIRETDYDIAVEQPVNCDYAGRCDTRATCISAAAGSCVNNVCTGNGNACSTDADCNFCSDNLTEACTSDASCRSFTCEGGANAGIACTTDDVCVDYAAVLVCMGGSTDGATCAGPQNTLSDTCGPKTITKAHIPRKYTGPFQTIAIGPGHVYDGNGKTATDAKYGSDYGGFIDSIELSGGEFLAVPLGACCMPDNSCNLAPQSACSQIVGAFYAGDNVSCEQARCDAGACCTDQGCMGERTEVECAALGGEYQGRGSSCDGSTCGGACCGPRGACTDTFVNTCSGDFRGLHTSCATSTPCCPSPYPDWDGDNDVDSSDFAFLQRCMLTTGGSPFVEPGCSCVDHNHDGLINSVDVELFVGCATGPGISSTPVSPECAP